MTDAIGPVTLVTETACQTGAWTPSKSAGQQVNIGDTLGTVVFSGLPCDVTASSSGIINWIRPSSQVNMGFDVCRIV
jgi:predicted deacylase